MGAEISRSMPDPILWISHRRELQSQALLAAPWVVSRTIQSITDADIQSASSLVLDECHHYRSDDWGRVAASGKIMLGLTATPQRPDGRALGSVFSEIVVAATYSELIAQGHLVDCHVYSVNKDLGRNLAMSPIDAYRRYCDGRACFAFFSSVKMARDWADKFSSAGIGASCVTGSMSSYTRDNCISYLSSGEPHVLCSVQTMTEGVDVPAASAALLCRSVQHVSQYLQIAGRILRPHQGKEFSVLVDLTGTAIKHGSPTQDRSYSLDGKGIEKESLSPLRNCLQCGACFESTIGACPRCGWIAPVRVQRPPRIYSLELERVFSGADTPQDAKAAELDRLCKLAVERGYRATWVAKQYQLLFGSKPAMSACSEALKFLEFEALKKESSGFKRGYAFARYKSMFGSYPR